MSLTNPYFNNYNGTGEQRLIEDLIVESIKNQGFETRYIPNVNEAARDLLYGEDPLRTFTTNYPIEMYLSNMTEYGGTKEFFSKFQLEIRNNVTAIVSRRSFQERVPQTYARPREGDLVYIPFLNGTGELFEIKFVDQTKDFFMLGREHPYFYEISMERFKYSQEVVATGDYNIDDIVPNSGYLMHININLSSLAFPDYLYQEEAYQTPDHTYYNKNFSGTVQSWNRSSGLLVLSNVSGELVDGGRLQGLNSGANYIVDAFDPLGVNSPTTPYDNETIEGEAQNIVVNAPNGIGNI